MRYFKSLLITTLLLLSACSAPEPDNALVVEIDKAVTENMVGMGVQWSAYPHGDSEDAEWGDMVSEDDWQKMYRRLDYMQPQLFRVMDQAGWRYFKGVDADNQPITDFDTPEIKTLYKILDYAEENGVTVYFGEWGAPAFWGEEGGLERADDPRWITMIGAYLQHLVVDRGYSCIEYYTLVNEPNGTWASTDGDYQQWAKGARMLHEELVRRGLDDDLALAAPDVVADFDHPNYPITGMDWVRNAVQELDDFIGTYEVHFYPNGKEVRSGDLMEKLSRVHELTSATGKPLVLGEIGLKYHGEMGEENRRRAEADPHAGPNDSQMFVYEPIYAIDIADALIQSLKTGFQGAIAWDLDDAMHTVGDNGDPHNLKRWGMWNILGEEQYNDPADEKLRPWYYSWSLFTRHFNENAKIYDVNDAKYDDLRAVAGYHEANGKFTFAAVNRSDSTRTVPLQIPQLAGSGTHSYNIYQMTADTLTYTEATMAVPKRTVDAAAGDYLELELPGQSFVMVVNEE